MRIENSFIPVEGVGETTERRIWREGVTTWESFDPAVDVAGVGSTTADRIESFIAEALTHLDDGDSAYFDRTFPGGALAALRELPRGDLLFRHRDDRPRRTPRSGDDGELPPGRGDDHARRRRGSHRGAAPRAVRRRQPARDVQRAPGSMFPSSRPPSTSRSTRPLDLMYPCKRIGLSGGLKPIEKEIGIERDRPDLSGRDAVRLWREYERGDDDALDTLVSYNREDTKNLRTLADTVTETLHEDVFVGETVER